MADLKACPFCGGKAAFVPRAVNIALQKDPSNPVFGVSVICGKCGSESPNVIDEARAAEFWNRREAAAGSAALPPPPQTADSLFDLIPPSAADNWRQYAKDGETAQACIERHRREQDALMNLLANAQEPLTAEEIIALLPAGWTGMLVQVVEFAHRIQAARGVPHRESDSVTVETLRQHWLRAIECDHATGRDKPHCACSRVDLGWHPSVGAAVEAWLAHVSGAPAESAPNAVLGRDGVLRVEAPAAGVPESDSMPRAAGVKASETGHSEWHDLNSAADAVERVGKAGDWDETYCAKLSRWLRQLAALGVSASDPLLSDDLCDAYRVPRGSCRSEVEDSIGRDGGEALRELLREAQVLIDSMATWFRNQPLGCPPAGTAQWEAKARAALAAGVPVPASAPETPMDQPEKRPGEIPGCNAGNRCPWGEESAPDWRSICSACGRRAQGSGQ